MAAAAMAATATRRAACGRGRPALGGGARAHGVRRQRACGDAPSQAQDTLGAYGRVESVRVRRAAGRRRDCVAVVAARKGGGALAEEGSMNAYVADAARDALAASMEEFEGSVLRVDRVRAPTKGERCQGRAQAEAEASNGYDPRRTVFVGGLPYDVREDELGSSSPSPPRAPATSDYGVEAARGARARHRKGKGVATCFKTRTGAREVLVRKAT